LGRSLFGRISFDCKHYFHPQPAFRAVSQMSRKRLAATDRRLAGTIGRACVSALLARAARSEQFAADRPARARPAKNQTEVGMYRLGRILEQLISKTAILFGYIQYIVPGWNRFNLVIAG
jgi:hypothetical protein